MTSCRHVRLYDVINLTLKKENKHTHLFNSYPEKHSEPIWSIKWLQNDVEDNLRFVSIGGDGKVRFILFFRP